MVAATAPWQPEPWVQPPAYFTHPEFDYSAGYRVADFLSSLTFKDRAFVPDPDQRNVLAAMFAGPRGATFQTRHLKWAASSHGIVAPRQNIKTSVAFMGTLGALFLLDALRVTWTAHLFNPTTKEAFEDFQQIIDENRVLARRVKTIHTASGRESIFFTNGAKIRFIARSKGGGLGTGGDLVVLDEGWALTPDHVSALLPTKSAKPNSQVWYLSSAGHIDSAQLRIIRDRGREGSSARMVWAEWCGLSAMEPPGLSCDDDGCSHGFGSPGCVLDDREEWARANPALGRRIDVSEIEDERAQMEPEKFARERLGWWDEPKGGNVISLSAWTPLQHAADTIDGPVAVFVDVTIDRKTAFIAVCGRNTRGVPQVEIAAAEAGTGWVTDKVNAMLTDHQVLAVGARSSGPVTSLLADLKGLCEASEVAFDKVGSGDFAGMCGGFYDAVSAGNLAHLDDPRIGTALAAARRHQVVDAWSWERSRVDVDAAPLVAVTGALALFTRHEAAAAETYDPLDNIW